MDAPLPASDALIRPWRTATLVASLVAAIELVLLIGLAALLLAKPLAHAVQHHAQAAAFKPAAKKATPAPVKRVHHVVAKAKHPRSATGVFVFNGNGVSGAASSEAARLSGLGYLVRGKTNAKRQDYASSVVMYAPGFEGEGRRLARDLGVKVVGPLDGMKRSALHGGQLAVVLGAA
jgi:LytR cell envelope-related transcriptional attenuator